MERRDPEMHQTKKGNQWHFGMKAHIGVDADSGLTHTLVKTAANVSDITQAHALLHGDETTAFGDAGYQGVEKRQENEKSAPRVRPELEKISEIANSLAMHAPNWIRATSTPDEFISAVPKSRMKMSGLHQSFNCTARP